jgi:hypothetical protein
MSYEYEEYEYEPEPQASGSRRGIPPRKITGVAVLDPPAVPPRKQPRPLLPIPTARIIRIFAIVILLGLLLMAVFAFARFEWIVPLPR